MLKYKPEEEPTLEKVSQVVCKSPGQASSCMYLIDYGSEATPSSLQFEPNGTMMLCTRVEIINDDIIESFILPDENFFVQLTSSPFERVNIAPDLARVFIQDDDGKQINYLTTSMIVLYSPCDWF